MIPAHRQSKQGAIHQERNHGLAILGDLMSPHYPLYPHRPRPVLFRSLHLAPRQAERL
jgi:hypothetical protein